MMKQTSNTCRFLSSAVSTLGNVGMILMLCDWLATQKIKKEKMEVTELSNRQKSEHLWKLYVNYRTIYRILMDYVTNGLFLTSQLMDSAREYLKNCQMYFQKEEPFMEKQMAETFGTLLRYHDQFVEGIVWELYEPSPPNKDFDTLRDAIYTYEKKTIACLQEQKTKDIVR